MNIPMLLARARSATVSLSALFCALCSIASPAFAEDAPFEMTTESGVMVPMRDGVLLATDIHRPDAEGEFPVVLSRTPYGRAELQPLAAALAPQGYVFVLQDVRGRFDSEGEWEPFYYDAEDGFDTIEWITEQPWSNDKIVMVGGSYAAGTQWLAARERPEGLVGLVPFVSPGDIYDIIWTDGALSLSVAQTWSWLMEEHSFTMEKFNGFGTLPWNEVFTYVPVLDGLDMLESSPDFYRKWIHHSTPDDYWRSMNWRQSPPDLPVLHIGGWYDIFQRDVIRNFEVMRSADIRSRERQMLVVGPWAHKGQGQTVGDVDFGPDAAVNVFAEEMLPFFDYCFEGAQLDWEHPVRVFTMGENRWNEYEDWPAPGVEGTEYFFGSTNGANSSAGDGYLTREAPSGAGTVDEYTYDPSDPVPTRGGNSCCWPELLPWGPMDQSEIETRDDVLVYSTTPLEEDLRITGPIEVILYVSSSAPDTDFTAKLVDVSPDGFAMNITDGIQRVRYRESYDTPQFLEDGEVVEVRIDLGYTSNLFKQGHQIRVEISSSNFPRFSRNTNTGRLPETDAEMVAAQQSVHASQEYPSRIVLPVMR